MTEPNRRSLWGQPLASPMRFRYSYGKPSNELRDTSLVAGAIGTKMRRGFRSIFTANILFAISPAPFVEWSLRLPDSGENIGTRRVGALPKKLRSSSKPLRPASRFRPSADNHPRPTKVARWALQPSRRPAGYHYNHPSAASCAPSPGDSPSTISVAVTLGC